MLRSAGLEIAAHPSDLDESPLKARLEKTGSSGRDIALALAEAKARAVATHFPDALVIGADQILDCDGRRYDKPANREEARAQLIALRGRTHELVSAAAVVQGDRLLWRHAERAQLRMRDFSDAFLDRYLIKAASGLTGSVGAYQLEGLGAQLFSSVEGDFFVILGLPLISLLAFLREEGVIEV